MNYTYGIVQLFRQFEVAYKPTKVAEVLYDHDLRLLQAPIPKSYSDAVEIARQGCRLLWKLDKDEEWLTAWVSRQLLHIMEYEGVVHAQV